MAMANLPWPTSKRLAGESGDPGTGPMSHPCLWEVALGIWGRVARRLLGNGTENNLVFVILIYP